MDSDPGLDARTTTCPACHAEIELPLRATDAEGNYSIECTHCKITLTGRVHPDPGTL
jgi:hypothetical protein